MYQAFAEKYIYPLRRENFEIEIDLTDFLIDNREKLAFDYFTRYYEFSGGCREIVFSRNELTKKFSVYLLDEVAWAYVDRQEFSYNWEMPSVHAIFGIKNEEPGIEKLRFDRQTAFKAIRRSLQRQFFTREFARLEDTCSYVLESKIQHALSLFSYQRDEYLFGRAEKRQQKLLKKHNKFLQQMTNLEAKEKEKDKNGRDSAEQ